MDKNTITEKYCYQIFECSLMLTIILHHSALELINESVCNIKHKAIQNDSIRRKKKPAEILLDLSVHQSAIFPDKVHLAGRPDLVHLCLLQYHFLMELLSPDLQSNIELIVHTRNNFSFSVPPLWRVPVHFIRFRGLMEKFLVEKNISLGMDGELLLQEHTLGDLIKKLDPFEIIKLIETGLGSIGTGVELLNIIKRKERAVLLIGGFQKGEYNLAEGISYPITEQKIIDKPTTAWMIVNLLFTGLILKN